MEDHDRTASLMSPAKLAQMARPKAAATPASFLDQMAADAGHQHVARLAELRKDLEAQVRQRDYSELAEELANVAKVLPTLDFSLLQQNRGLWARVSGKSRTTGQEFSGQFEQLEDAVSKLGGHIQAIQKKLQEQAAATDRSLLEFEVEYRAIEKSLDQGARWLQDMRNQLKARQAQATDDATRQQIRDDAARCEILVARLKQLRAVSSAAQHSHQQVQAAAERRTGLLSAMHQKLGASLREWNARMEPLISAEGKDAEPQLDKPMEAHRELQLFVKQSGADCGQLDALDKSLIEGFAALGTALDAAAV